jgi:hypothetical protein
MLGRKLEKNQKLPMREARQTTSSGGGFQISKGFQISTGFQIIKGF